VKDRKLSQILPKLRFPEFRDKPGWKVKILGRHGVFLSSLLGKKAKDFDTGNSRYIPYKNVFTNQFTDISDLRCVNVGKEESQNAVAIGDVFFTVSSETPEECGMSSVLLEEIHNCYLNSFCIIFRFDEEKSLDLLFLGYFFRSQTVRKHLSKGSQGSTRYNISRLTFFNLPLLVTSRMEQQKIAHCLGSLDDLITAAEQKLEALKQHKCGLMQLLFPSVLVKVNKTSRLMPKLRYPEFRYEAGWEVQSLSSICEINPSQAKLPSSFVYIDLKSVKSGVLLEHNLISRNEAPSRASRLLSPNDIIFQTVMPSQRNNFFFEIENDYHYVASSGYAQLRAKGSALFLYHLLHTDLFVNCVLRRCQGSIYQAINQSDLSSIPVSIPSLPEQQKIAHCLGSLDGLITAAEQKLQALQNHKLGLMENLFPSVEKL